MTVQEQGTVGGVSAADVRVRVPRRPKAWGSRVRWTRHAVQAGVVAVVGWQAVGHVTSGGESAEAWCPLGGFESLWTLLTTGRTVPHVHTSSLVLSLAVLVLAVVGRGFFCGWLCPMGTVQEMVHAAGRAVTDRVPPLRRLRRRMERGASATTGRWRRIDGVLRCGRWLVLAWAIIGAAITGTMVFREADPWVALLSVAEFELSLAFVVLIATLVLALFIERPFCRYACPLGAVQSLAGKFSPIAVEREASACLDCDLCNQACPMAIPVNTRTRVTDTSCTGCLECVGACPSQNGLAVTLAMPTFRAHLATPPATEPDRKPDPALELMK
jgi:Pyruvate/2-oxoacid:ferredoxin oxidoreductase delta subunit